MTVARSLDDKLYTPIAVARDGHFTVTNLGKRISLTGRIVNGTATGNFRINIVYGGLLACKTKPIRFSARA